MIAVKKLGLKQGEFSLHDLNFEIPEGKYGVLVGKSGCGKTTLLEAVCGLRPINAGRILLGSPGSLTNPVSAEGIRPPGRSAFSSFERCNKLLSLVLRKPTIPNSHGSGIGRPFGHFTPAGPDARCIGGGECQRSPGQGAVHSSKFLCLDEPLSALDARLTMKSSSCSFKRSKERGNRTPYHSQQTGS